MIADHIARRVKEVARQLEQAHALLVTAGAGMSVDSGLPDFRGNQGFWRAYPPLGKLGISFERMAQPHWFVEQPRFTGAVWGDRAIYELHGNIHRLQCVEPCREETWLAELPDLQIDLDTLTAQGDLPRCPACGALARPNVLMFNDAHWVDAVAREQGRRFDQWLAQARGRRLVILEFGAGTALPTIRRLGERIAQRSFTTLVRINPDAREESEELIALPMGALEASAAIAEAMSRRRSRPQPVAGQ